MTETYCPVCGAPSRRTILVRRKQPALCPSCFETRSARAWASSAASRIPRGRADLAADEIERLYERARRDQRAARRRLTS